MVIAHKNSLATRVLTGFLLTTFLATPVMADCLGMQVHAHRGSDIHTHPENSLAALQAGYTSMADGVETDVQQLGDETWVIHHDAFTGRTVQAGYSRPVNQLSGKDWRSARMNLGGAPTDVGPPFVSDIVRLASAFPNKTLNVEIKEIAQNCESIQKLVNELQQNTKHGNWFLTSGATTNLRCARNADPVGYLGLIVFDIRNAEVLGTNRVTRFISQKARAPRLDQNWLLRVQNEIGMPVGIHVDAKTLDANPLLMSDANLMKMPVFVYAVDGDSRLLQSIRQSHKKTGRWPSGVVIDGNAESFCRQLQ